MLFADFINSEASMNTSYYALTKTRQKNGTVANREDKVVNTDELHHFPDAIDKQNWVQRTGCVFGCERWVHTQHLHQLMPAHNQRNSMILSNLLHKQKRKVFPEPSGTDLRFYSLQLDSSCRTIWPMRCMVCLFILLDNASIKWYCMVTGVRVCKWLVWG